MLVPLLLAVACAKHKPATDDDPSAEVLVEVANDQSPPAPITVFIESEGGSRRLLGTVPPTATRTFHYKPLTHAARFVLLARLEGDGTIGSQPFTLTGTAGVSWSLRNNVLQFMDAP
jgi:hypothetical protein